MITFDDFSKLEIKIGKILFAETVEDADRLLKLSVDIGEENPRQIISGIREYYGDPEELIGLQCAFLTNLEAKMIRGLESQGMILAATDASGGFALLTPSNNIAPGAGVR